MKGTWPEEVFKRTKVVRAYPATNKNLALLFSMKQAENKGLTGMMVRAFDKPEGVLEDGLVVDGFQVIEKCSGVRGRNQIKTIGFLVNGDEKGENMNKLANEIVSLKLRDIGIAAAAVGNQEVIRKLLEVSFWNIDVEITLYLPPGNGNSITKQQTRKESNVDIIKVNSTLSYSEMVSKVREKVTPSQIGVQIKDVKKSNKNELLIITEQGEDTDKLIKEIMDNAGEIEGLVATKVSQSRPYMIMGIESMATEDNIVEVIENATGRKKEDIGLEMKKLSEEGRRNRTAEIWLNSEAGSILEKKEKITIGWRVSYIKRKVRVERCIKCLKMGHHSSVYKNTNTQKKCFNCTKEGHFVTECQNQSFCNACNVAGHRPDSGKCPKFRKLINQV